MPDAQFYFAGPVTEVTIPPLLQAIGDRVDKGARSLTLALSSGGGNTFWGITAYNFLRGLGVAITTHNAGRVDSVATVIYCAGDRRLATPESRFLLHGVQVNFTGPNIALSEEDLKRHVAGAGQESLTLATILADRTQRPLAKVRADLLKAIFLDAEKAKAYGLVTSIRSQLFDPDQEVARFISA